MSGIKRYFSVTSGAKKPKTRTSPANGDVVDLTDANESKPAVATPAGSTSTNKTADVAASASARPARAASKPMAAKPTASKPTAAARKPASTSGTSASPESILASIESPPLPITTAETKGFHAAPPSKHSGKTFNFAPNCLVGMNFVVTGDLPTLGREETQSLIKQYGGKVTGAVSGRTTCLVVGSDAGPSKLAKAQQLNVKLLDENGLLKLLEKMPADGGSGALAARGRAAQVREAAKVESEAASLANYGGVNELWTTKYAPRSTKDVCGNALAVRRLREWLSQWQAARKGKASNDGAQFKAAMLSGPPGVGKTTAAHLVGDELGFDVVEYNASETRSKSLLGQRVAQTLSNSCLSNKDLKKTRPLMVVMDEVDGLGAGDRGGVGAMAQLARTTAVPLVLICNERSLPKMRPFDRVVYDIRFNRPTEADVRRRLLAIAKAEKLQLSDLDATRLVQSAGADLRQLLVLLSAYAAGSENEVHQWTREAVLKPFDIAAQVLSAGRRGGIAGLMELYFHDYEMAPLMVQENYLQTCPSVAAAASAAESISESDIVGQRMRGAQQQWGLMPLHALLSCAAVGAVAAGQARGRFGFTSYLGNYSRTQKFRRLLAELRSHLRLRLPLSDEAVRLDLQPPLAAFLLAPLLQKGAPAVQSVIDLMDKYYLTREDFDTVMDLGVGNQSSADLARTLPTKVKSAFTRAYNGASHPLPFMRSAESKTATAGSAAGPRPDFDGVIDAEDDANGNEAEETPNDEKGDDVEQAVKTDKYIKIAKPKRAPKSAPKRRKA